MLGVAQFSGVRLGLRVEDRMPEDVERFIVNTAKKQKFWFWCLGFRVWGLGFNDFGFGA